MATDAPKKGRLTLYEDLLSDATIAEMKAKDAQAQAEAAKKTKDASLMFKPTNLGKKPANKPAPKPKPSFASMPKVPSSTSTTTISAPPTTNSPQPAPPQQPPSSEPQAESQQSMAQKRGFSDWLANEDEEEQFYGRPRQNDRKKKKKNKQVEEEWSWGDVYDPSAQVNLQEYRRSDDRYDAQDAWKDRLHAARRHERERRGRDSRRAWSDDGSRSRSRPPQGNQFAPPTSFAPPAEYDSNPVSRPQSGGPSSGRNSALGQRQDSGPPRMSFAPPADLDMDESGDDAFARRQALAGMAPARQPAAPLPPVPQQIPSVPPPAPVSAPKPPTAEDEEKKAKAAAQIAALKARMAAAKSGSPVNAASSQGFAPAASASPPVTDVPPPPPPEPKQPEPPAQSGVISAAPTFNPEYYAKKAEQEASARIESAEDEQQAPEDPDAPRSKAPGQAGFAQRMMEKMGWEKGSGLGASGDGITTAIVAKANKRKKLPDSAGGGFATPANMGKIVGGKKKKTAATTETDDPNGRGKVSEVIKLEGMLNNLDVDQEIQDNNLLQEIGDEMGEFGTVERLFIWREHMGGKDEVFVKFTSQLSAVNAVEGMDGTEFADNQVKARFWDAERFERGEYA